jgi:transposase-like protein
MKAMAKHRSHSIEFKRQVAQEFIVGERSTLSPDDEVSHNLIRIWVRKFEAGSWSFDDEAAADRKDRGTRTHGRSAGPGNRLLKRGSERTAAEKREAMIESCDEFENYGYRRVGAELRHPGMA